jgi:hypothetical protein
MVHLLHPGPSGRADPPARAAGLLARHESARPAGTAPLSAPVTLRRVIVPKVLSPKNPLEVSELLDDGRMPSHLNAYWHVLFCLTERPAKDGFLVQRVDRSLDVIADPAREYAQGVLPNFHYEAWIVRAMHTKPGVRSEKRYATRNRQNAYPPGHDHFGWWCARGTRGVYRQCGVVMFYEGPLPAGFKQDHEAVNGAAGQLFAAPKAPEFWKNGKGVARELLLRWDLTGPEAQWRVSMTAKVGQGKPAQRHLEGYTNGRFIKDVTLAV